MDTDMDGRKCAFTYRRALEALRSGVPNQEAVKILEHHQPQAQNQFTTLLRQCADQQNPPTRSLGMLVAGGFGSGKSHLLSYLEHQALSQGFVCSRVAVSKETPLYDLGKVFKSAVDHGRMPDHSGQLMEELRLHENSETYTRFLKWVDSEQNGLHPMFLATLVVHEHEKVSDPELISDIRAFWSGGKKPMVSKVKNGLKAIGQLQNYAFRAPKASELPPQRLRFATELIKGAGYQGWVVLLDEIELVGSYPLLQRARSYAELARWLGKVPDEACPGLVVVGTVTDDYDGSILGVHGKQDRDKVGPRLRSLGEDAVAARAKAGMRALAPETTIKLEPLTKEQETTTFEKLRYIYRLAYDWEAPRIDIDSMAGGVGHRKTMRYKIRAAINEWDLMRLYPNFRPETEGTDYRPSYHEDPEL